MLSQIKADFAQLMVDQARLSSHVWPEYAAAEACLESAWGQSSLCTLAHNIFGNKAPIGYSGRTISMNTKEILNGKPVIVPATWISFDSYADAFTARMETLKRLAPEYPDYANALAATSGPYFVMAVSKRWSTDPDRGEKVLAIYSAHPEIFHVLIPPA